MTRFVPRKVQALGNHPGRHYRYMVHGYLDTKRLFDVLSCTFLGIRPDLLQVRLDHGSSSWRRTGRRLIRCKGEPRRVSRMFTTPLRVFKAHYWNSSCCSQQRHTAAAASHPCGLRPPPFACSPLPAGTRIRARRCRRTDKLKTADTSAAVCLGVPLPEAGIVRYSMTMSVAAGSYWGTTAMLSSAMIEIEPVA